jgi:hypothetical protein
MRSAMQAPATGLPMLRILAMGLALLVVSPAFARADEQTQPAPNTEDDLAAKLNNDQIVIHYSPPVSHAFVPVYERLKRLKTLEQLKEFLSPLKIPEGVQLKITTKECGTTNSWWSGRTDGLFLCYEWPDWLERLASSGALEGYNADDSILGGFLQVAFHELGHGMFDIYNIPVLGKEEDAADQMAGFILTEFGPEIARRTFPGTAYVWKRSYEEGGAWPRSLFSDVHGNDLQRSYNYLCMAYGSDQQTFQYNVDNGLLPKERAVNCRREFLQIQNAFIKTMLPHIDTEKLKLVQGKTDWLPTTLGR